VDRFHGSDRGVKLIQAAGQLDGIQSFQGDDEVGGRPRGPSASEDPHRSLDCQLDTERVGSPGHRLSQAAVSPAVLRLRGFFVVVEPNNQLRT
jgi:hypothetical protein